LPTFGSVPLARREIFSLCLANIIRVIINATGNFSPVSNNIIITGKKPKETSAPREEYFVTKTVDNHKITVKRAVKGEYMLKTPRLVATPLPPLNFRKRE
jgi:hypothetical protein